MAGGLSGIIDSAGSLVEKIPVLGPIAGKIVKGIGGIVGGGGNKQQQQQPQIPQIPQMPQMPQGVYDMGQQMGQMPQMGRELINTGMNAFGGIRDAFKSGDYGGAIEQGIQGAGDMFQQGRNIFNKGKSILQGASGLAKQFRGGGY
jgi:hypothetical protein